MAKAKRKPCKRADGIVLHLCDAHIPYGDPYCLRFAKDAVRILKPEHVVLNGDIIDCYAISKYDKNPNRKLDLQTEFDKAHAWIAELRQLAPKSCKFHYLEGNHEERLRKYLSRNARELASLRCLSLPAQLGAEKLGVVFYPYGYRLVIGDVRFTHGNYIRTGAGNSGRAHVERTGASVAIGHSHRLSKALYTQQARRTTAWEGGCLCRLDMDYLTDFPDWQQGLLAFRFRNGRCVDDLVLDLRSPRPLDQLTRFASP